jgi:hypothetical protein
MLIMNGELGRIWKENIVAFPMCGGTRKISNPEEIRINYLLNNSPENYSYMKSTVPKVSQIGCLLETLKPVYNYTTEIVSKLHAVQSFLIS